MQPTLPVIPGINKQETYWQICKQLQVLLGDETDLVANAANTSALLFHSLPEINWVGFYFSRGSDLVLGPFQGMPACVRIARGKGVCGAAANRGESIVVPDVSDYPGHISCDSASRSEIVVPLLTWGQVIGVLDVDSPALNRFDEDDCEGLEAIAAILVASYASAELPDLYKEAASV